MIAFECPNCSSRLRPHDPVDASVIVASASKSTLHLYDSGPTAISVITAPVVTVSVRVIPIIGIGIGIRIRIEERETKRVDKDERSIVEPIVEPVETVEAIVDEPILPCHGPRCWPRHCGARHPGTPHHW